MPRSEVSFKRFDSAMQNRQHFFATHVPGTGAQRITWKTMEHKEYVLLTNPLICKEQLSIYIDDELYSCNLYRVTLW